MLYTYRYYEHSQLHIAQQEIRKNNYNVLVCAFILSVYWYSFNHYLFYSILYSSSFVTNDHIVASFEKDVLYFFHDVG